MENLKEEQLQEEPKTCDPATRPPSSPVPAGYSNQSYTKCNTTTGQYEWVDPQIAPE